VCCGEIGKGAGSLGESAEADGLHVEGAQGVHGDGDGDGDGKSQASDSKYTIIIGKATGVQIGDEGIQSNSLGDPEAAAAARAPAHSDYVQLVRQIAPPFLVAREQELAELADFCTRPDVDSYLWWQADAWAGKTRQRCWRPSPSTRHPASAWSASLSQPAIAATTVGRATPMSLRNSSLSCSTSRSRSRSARQPGLPSS
jgi:hypothetical protein